jgi:hypothetical protein
MQVDEERPHCQNRHQFKPDSSQIGDRRWRFTQCASIFALPSSLFHVRFPLHTQHVLRVRGQRRYSLRSQPCRSTPLTLRTVLVGVIDGSGLYHFDNLTQTNPASAVRPLLLFLT